MNLTTLIGLLGFWSVVIVAMILAYSVGAYIDVTSIVIVFGGTSAVVVFSFEGFILKEFVPVLKEVFKPTNNNHDLTIRKIVELSIAFKKGGVEALENDLIPKEEDPLLLDLMKSMSNNVDTEVIEDINYGKLEAIEGRHTNNQQMIQEIGNIAGSTGMIGTLIGLVAMLLNMSDPSAIGPAMAVALLTTLYGALIGTGFAGPISNKLKLKTQVELKSKSLQIQGIIFLLKGDSPRIIEQKLFSSLKDNEKNSYW